MSEDFKNQREYRIFGVFFLGIIFFFTSAYFATSKVRFLSSAEESIGVVTNLTAGGSHPEIEFSSKTGQSYTTNQGGFIFGYKEGMQVKVYYLPEDPGISAVIDDIGAIWYTPAFFAIFSVVLFGYGTLEIIRRKRDLRK
ncbi:DUF3592 domain-containing protein [Pseudomonas aeruginosa]|uniref:DUF3592 domain-containing protein n=1 Tax=Pseudomonas aeruginosa TaxID=287 RepID=UPI000F53A973|nr:DUF3592 domain-containing protein [Pseudomonas aeruginosa]RQB32248.1 hypothetical protein IPC452_12790 [Pseudomonas aeruginosa]